MENEKRNSIIIKTSIIGIVSNILLATLKLIFGLMANSPAITTDAVNNYSDATSSIVTIAGAKLAAKPADKKHPFGYGRIEYLSAMIIGILVFYAGFTAFTDAVKMFFNKTELPSYSGYTLLVVCLALPVKFFLAKIFISKGKLAESDSLQNSGKDALFDCLISCSTIVGVLVYKITSYSVEPYIAAFISVFILKAGLEMIIETISIILGESGDIETAKKIRSTILSHEGVKGAYDLVLNNYGPNAFSGSVQISVPDTFTAWDIDELIRKIQVDVYEKHNVVLNAIGVYSINTKDEEIKAIEKKISEIVLKTEFVTQIHGFHVNKAKQIIRFDVVISFDAKDRTAVYNTIMEKVSKEFADYKFQITVDTDYFES